MNKIYEVKTYTDKCGRNVSMLIDEHDKKQYIGSANVQFPENYSPNNDVAVQFDFPEEISSINDCFSSFDVCLQNYINTNIENQIKNSSQNDSEQIN